MNGAEVLRLWQLCLYFREGVMDMNKFAVKVAKKEGLKDQVDIAQIKEILHIINELTNGILYAVCKLL